MKARAITKKSQIKQEVYREFEALHTELYQKAVDDITAQLFADILFVLEKNYGWKEKRLRDFLDACKNMMDMMDTPTGMTSRWTTIDNEKYIKEKFGIDLRQEIKTEVEVRPGRKEDEG